MKAIAAYMANKTREGGNERRNEYSNQGRREYENGSEYGGIQNRVYNANDQRQTNQYSTRNGMDENWPQDNEMRRRRDSNGRYMTDYDGGAESRYRGRDGRWKAGRRRSEFEGGMGDEWPEDNDMTEDARAYEARNEYQPQRSEYGRAESRFKPDYPIAPRETRNGMPEGRRIGFGNQDRAYEAQSHYSGEGGENNQKGQMIRAGGTFWMENPDQEKLDKKEMEKWVHKMKDDKEKPIEPWSTEEIKPLAMRFGYPSSGEKFDIFYTAIHMMKSDFCAVAEEFDVDVPAFYAALADAWLKDPDAALQNREKLEAYHKYIVKGKK